MYGLNTLFSENGITDKNLQKIGKGLWVFKTCVNLKVT